MELLILFIRDWVKGMLGVKVSFFGKDEFGISNIFE